VKALVTALLLGALAIQANANPSSGVVKACLRTESAMPEVRYTPIDAGAFEVIEDQETRTTATVLRHGKNTVGTWEGPVTFGLFFNGKKTPLKNVIRLDKAQAPTAFSPYEAIWGVAEEGKRSYICATFTFSGLGNSGSFQNARGSYLMERSKLAKVPFYAVGNIASNEK
jgi:hypothetical protein